MLRLLKPLMIATFFTSMAWAQTAPNPAGSPSAPTPTTSTSNSGQNNPNNAVNSGAIVQPKTTTQQSTTTTTTNPNNNMSSVQPTSSRMSMNADQIRSAQVQLSSSGYAVNADGVMGGKTADAIRAFQRNRGLQETGWFDQQTLNALQMKSSDDRSPSSVNESPR